MPLYHRLAVVVAVLLAGLVYINALDNPFVYDDRRLVVENRSLRPPLNLTAIVLHEVTRPVVNLTYAIDRTLWGPSPFGFHVTNVLLHMLNVALLFEFGRRATGRRLAAFMAAAIFAVHPLMTQAVGYISGRAELLCAVFLLLAFEAARRWMLEPFSRPPSANPTRITGHSAEIQQVARQSSVRTALGGHGAWLAATFGLWLLALASKETAVIFVLVLVYDRLILGQPGGLRPAGLPAVALAKAGPPDTLARGGPVAPLRSRGSLAAARSRDRLWRLHVPVIAVVVVAVVVRLAVFVRLEHPGQIGIDWRFALLELDVLRRYLTLLVSPGGQTILHELAPVTGWLDPRVLLGLGVLGVLGAIAWRMRRVDGLVTFGILWFMLALVPSAALVTMGMGEPMAEQRAYVASAGLFLAIGAAVARFEAWRRWNTRRGARILFRGIVAAVLVLLSMHTVLRNAVWGHPVTLWSEAIDRAPNSWHAQLLFGEALHDAGRHDEAIGAFTTALRTRPDEPAIYGKLGLCLIEVGQIGPAAAAFEKLRQLQPRSPDGSNGIAAIALISGQLEQARSLYEETLLFDPWNVPARVGLAKIEELQGNAAAALRRCQEIRDLAPETPGNEECLSRNRARIGSGGSGRR